MGMMGGDKPWSDDPRPGDDGYSTEPTRELPQPKDIPTREVGSKYLKPGDKVRLRGTERQGEVEYLSEDKCEALVRWDGDEHESGYYDVRDLVKRDGV